MFRFHRIEKSRHRKRYHAPVVLALGMLAVALSLLAGGRKGPALGVAVSEGEAPQRNLGAYPEDLFIKKNLVSGLMDDGPSWSIIFHIVGICYMILGLNVVCDAYFCEALELMVSEWKVQPDVAGATFMAAGGSAPELFTSIVGVFVAESDIGFGTIVGSAVFNVLFVIGLCAAVSSVPLALTWWPLFRDCTYYVLGLLVLSLFAYDQVIELYEAVILFMMYLGYITIMWFNQRLEKFVKGFKGKPVDTVEGDAAGDAAGKDVEAPPSQKVSKNGSFVTPRQAERDHEKTVTQEQEEEDDEGGNNPFEEMKGASGVELALIVLGLPITASLWLFVPDCTTDKWKKYFVATFGVSLIWIAFYSYMLVWWATIVGDVVGIPTVVMGYTFLAAGTSIPDAISSMVMAKLGEGDMAVSSSIGSNVFDILVGLPLPWMIYNAYYGETITVLSPYLVVNVMILLFMVFMVVVSIHLQGWVLNKALGMIMAGLYFVFLIAAVTIEVEQPSWLRTD